MLDYNPTLQYVVYFLLLTGLVAGPWIVWSLYAKLASFFIRRDK